MNHAAVEKVRQRLRSARADAYVAYTPSNIFYLTGFQSYFVSEWWRMHGTVLAVVPTDEDKPVSLVISDFEAATARAASPDVSQHMFRLWVDIADASELAATAGRSERLRPEQYDPAELDAATTRALGDVTPTNSRIATDLEHISLSTANRIQRCAPGIELTDFTDQMYEVRLIKETWEIARLTRGVELSEAGMSHAAANLRPGLSARNIRLLYQRGVLETAQADERYAGYTDSWVLPTVGARTSASYGDVQSGLQNGDLVKFDCGTTVDGYRSDGGRTYSLGEPAARARHLYKVLRQAQELACSQLRPGTPLANVYKVAMEHVRASGYPSYNRGHVGHSVGIDTFHEEPPYISASCERLVGPNMVFAVEVPSYTPDVGAIMIEDLLLTTEGDPVCLHSLPHDLMVM